MPGLLLTFTLCLLILVHGPWPTLANTEIINFSAGHPTSVAPLPANWTTTVLHAGKDEIIVRHITPAPRNAPCAADDNECPHDLWLALDLDHDRKWTHYDRFTLRVSWPASHPATVAISLHPPPAPASTSASAPARMARLHLARVRLTEEGVRVPAASTQNAPVPFVVRLEPLVLGVLPISVVPVVATLLVVLAAAAYGVVPVVLRVVGDAAGRARRELEFLEKRRKG